MSSPSRNLIVRWGPYLVVSVAAAAFLWANRSDVPVATRILRHAHPGFIALGLVLVLVALINQTALHRAAQRATGLEPTFGELLRPIAAGGFLNLVIKSGAMAGMAPLLALATRRNRSRGRTIAGYLLVNVLGHLAFAAALCGSLIVLIVDGRFTRVDAIATGVFALTTAMQLLLVAAAVRSRTAIRRLYAIPHQLVRALRRREDRVEAQSSFEAADELFDSVQLFRKRPRAVMPAVGYALAVEMIGMTQLWCVLRALKIHPPLSVPVVAYSVSVLFTIVGFLPGGLGFVEAGLGAVLVSFGLTVPTAAATIVLYRLLELWIPMLIGAAAAHSVARTAWA